MFKWYDGAGLAELAASHDLLPGSIFKLQGFFLTSPDYSLDRARVVMSTWQSIWRFLTQQPL
jgi:hypothetical protein